MIKFYLITGFLGAGKTTFLKNMIQHFKQFCMRIIVNEFGKEGIDAKLLDDLGVAIDEINNGSIFCSCRLDQFQDALDHALVDPPEVLLVEASGLSDPTSIHQILTQNPQYNQIEYCGSICLVDAIRFEKVFSTARVCNKQISISDMILLNKTDIATPEQIAHTKNMILERYPDIEIHETSFGHIEPSWIENLRPRQHDQSGTYTKDVSLQKATITLKDDMTLYQLKQFLKLFVEDTFRIKGFVFLEAQNLLVSCTGSLINITPEPVHAEQQTNKLVALAGQGMPLRKSIESARKWYPNLIMDVT